MTKKEFEKETYLAPEWGLRVVRVERQFLDANSPGAPGDNDDVNEYPDDF